uniref:glutathione transferase n=1 Tax=Aegilops tauschii subsp. strangulata TaxID=200361 RepID=A0A453MQ90_AEGTS
MAPVKVFGPGKSRNVARVLMCLVEVGVEYEVVDMDLKALEHKSPEHLARNVPVRANPCFPGWESNSLRVARNFKVRASQIQDERSRPAEGR